MIGPLSGLQGMAGMPGMQNLKGISGMPGMAGMPDMQNLQGMTSMQGLGNTANIDNMTSMNNLNSINNVDTLSNDIANVETGNLKTLNDFMLDTDISQPANGTNTGDTELKADLQGFVEKNQEYDNNFPSDFSSPSGISTGDIADKFSDILGNYINGVNSQNKAAEKAVETFASGGNIDLHSVMIASEKASLSMQLAVQMRNKSIQAYQEISRIQV